MYWKRLNIGYLLLLALFSLSLGTLWAEETYEITESELSELETILTEQRTTLERQAAQLATLRMLTERQETTISELATSFNEYESETEQTIARLERRLWIERGVSVAIATLAIWIVLQ